MDLDGAVTAADSAALMQYVLNKYFTVPVSYLGDDTEQYTDVDMSGQTDAADAAALLQKALIGTYSLPIENR